MTTYAFLSPEWIVAARELYTNEHDVAAGDGSGPPTIKMNLLVTGAPFDDPTVLAHVDSTDGVFKIELGNLDDAEVKLTLDYTVARSILIEGDAGAGMRAFLTGKIKVEGNMAKLLALQSAGQGQREKAIRDQVRAITAT